jgi:hypothetical protein
VPSSSSGRKGAGRWFPRDHLEPLEIYRLGKSDLAFAALLPARPGWLEQEDYEELTRVGSRHTRGSVERRRVA